MHLQNGVCFIKPFSSFSKPLQQLLRTLAAASRTGRGKVKEKKEEKEEKEDTRKKETTLYLYLNLAQTYIPLEHDGERQKEHARVEVVVVQQRGLVVAHLGSEDRGRKEKDKGRKEKDRGKKEKDS